MAKKKRIPHILQSATGHNPPTRIIYFDSESYVDTKITDEEVQCVLNKEKVEKDHDLYMIGAVFKSQGERTYMSYREDRTQGIDKIFWQDVVNFARHKEPTIIWAHNARYDYQVTNSVSCLLSHGFEVTELSDDQPFFITFEKFITHSMKGKRLGKVVDDYEFDPDEVFRSDCLVPEQLDNGLWFIPKPKIIKIQILSSTNYYQDSLANLGKTFGLPKLDFDHNATFNLDDAEIYCKRDVEILEIAVDYFLTFVEREGLGGFSITSAGQSFKAFRGRFMPTDIYIHDNMDALKVERGAYAGGRTEVFQMGKKSDTVYLDVNSMYPAVMKKYRYPVELITFWRRATIEQVMNEIKNGNLICAEVLVNTNENVYIKKEERLIFPTGEFWTFLSTPEIVYAFEHNHLVELKNVAIYRAEDLFSEFVDYFYGMRLEAKEKGDEVHSYLYKLILNSLYGKFAQRNETLKIVGLAPKDQVGIESYYDPMIGYTVHKIFGGKVWQKDESLEALEAYNSFPAISAHVTANARMLLWRGIKTAGTDQVYYCDTDSIMCSRLGYERLKFAGLIDNKKLGYFKIEAEGEGEWFGGKDYIFIDSEGNRTVKIKGISKNARMIEPAPNGNLRFAVTVWGGLTKRLRKGSLTEYANDVIIKELKREYKKGHIQKNGRVTPFNLVLDKAKEEFLHALDDIFRDTKLRIPNEKDNSYKMFRAATRLKKLEVFRPNTGVSIEVFLQQYEISAIELSKYLSENSA